MPILHRNIIDTFRRAHEIQKRESDGLLKWITASAQLCYPSLACLPLRKRWINSYARSAACRTAKTVPPCRGTSPEGAEGVSHPRGRYDPFVYHAAAIMAVLFTMRNRESHSCACETPPALWATSCKAEEFSFRIVNGALRACLNFALVYFENCF